MSDNIETISPFLGYLNKIGQKPLLKPEEEKALFEELRIQKNLLGKICSKLQNSNLLDSEQQEQLKQVFLFKQHQAKDGQMKISPKNLGRLQDLIADWEEFTAMFDELKAVIQRLHDIQQRLVEANLFLVASIAKQFTFRDFPLSFPDLMQEGTIGLMTAIYKFRLAKGNRFSTYATWWISQAIRRALDEQSQLIRVPTYIIETRRRAEKAFTDLTKRLGREPEVSELAKAVNITTSRLRSALQAPKDLLSLDSPLEESDDKTTIADLIKDKMAITPEEEVLSQARREAIEKLLSTLTPKQASVIKLRYGLFDGEVHTLAQIGRKLKITRERVRQIEMEALSKLRHPTRQSYLDEILD